MRPFPIPSLLFAILLAGCADVAEDPPIAADLSADLAFVPAGVRVVAALEPARTAADLRAFIRALDVGLAGRLDSVEAHVRARAGALPLDPARDLDRAVAWMADGERPVVTARGRFDTDNLIARVDRAAPDSARRFSAGGATFWTVGGRAAFGVLPPDRIVAGGATLTSAGLVAGEGPGEPTLGIVRAVASFPAWIAVPDVEIPQRLADSLAARVPGPVGESLRVARAVRSAAAGGRIEEDRVTGSLFLWPAEGVTVEDLAAVVRGAVSVVRTDERLPAELQERLGRLEIDEEPSRVRISGELGTADLRALLARFDRHR